MRLLIANPNPNEAITESCGALAREAASAGTDVVAWTNRHGPPVIDSVYGDYMAGRPLSSIHGTASVPVTMIGCRQTPESRGGDEDRRLDSRGLIFVYEGPWLRSRRDP
jgi:hypothetical protein